MRAKTSSSIDASAGSSSSSTSMRGGIATPVLDLVVRQRCRSGDRRTRSAAALHRRRLRSRRQPAEACHGRRPRAPTRTPARWDTVSRDLIHGPREHRMKRIACLRRVRTERADFVAGPAGRRPVSSSNAMAASENVRGVLQIAAFDTLGREYGRRTGARRPTRSSASTTPKPVARASSGVTKMSRGCSAPWPTPAARAKSIAPASCVMNGSTLSSDAGA